MSKREKATIQSEEAAPDLEQLRRYLRLLDIGLAAGALFNADTVRWRRETVEALGREEGREKPPRPPRRPNAGIGRLALGHGF